MQPILLGIFVCSWAGSAFTSPIIPPEATGKDCAIQCTVAYNNCVDQSGTSRWECDEFYKACLSFNPFGLNGAMVTPTTCCLHSETQQ
ncbi:hypothetical protein BFJ63_vAg18074 [Fusarium oxysporum f. sp. narcissi]|uniref:Extracellular membrane protein CFEM domain-containing protein n=1 Tax=Fusarium oxysporum f. sp. narcissi TaxID=451672 RepID=A0A4Q2UX35_FUSOX|nr:hypothetical protein BFJ63_vAg18074 [Fusarium oxysporum f. sp. narcissi]